MNVHVYDVRTHWEDGWWMVSVPELGLVTQAEESDEIEWMARSVIASEMDIEIAEISVRVSFE